MFSPQSFSKVVPLARAPGLAAKLLRPGIAPGGGPPERRAELHKLRSEAHMKRHVTILPKKVKVSLLYLKDSFIW